MLFVEDSNEIPLHYLSIAQDVDRLNQLNWATAALAFQFNQIDDLCRGVKETISGISSSWEVNVEMFFVYGSRR